jgi:hypothetical protein
LDTDPIANRDASLALRVAYNTIYINQTTQLQGNLR